LVPRDRRRVGPTSCSVFAVSPEEAGSSCTAHGGSFDLPALSDQGCSGVFPSAAAVPASPNSFHVPPRTRTIPGAAHATMLRVPGSHVVDASCEWGTNPILLPFGVSFLKEPAEKRSPRCGQALALHVQAPRQLAQPLLSTVQPQRFRSCRPSAC